MKVPWQVTWTDLSRPTDVGEIARIFTALRTLAGRLAERRQLMARLREQTEIDPLTGLMSRRHFEERATDRIDAMAGIGCGVIVMDLDKFKSVNDTYGHHVGDALITTVGTALLQFADERTLIGRMGGDEFMLCCLDTPPTAREDLVRRIMGRIALIRQVDGIDLRVSASFGLSASRPNVDRFEALYREADTALYAAKANGRATYAWPEAEKIAS